MSDEDRVLLLKLQERLSTERDMDKVAELQEQYREVSNRSKQLNECNLEECSELKAHIYAKFQKANGISMYNVAAQFKEMIRQIDIRMGLVYADMAREAAIKLESKSEGTEKSSEQSKSKVRTSKNKSSWSVSFDDLDF